MTPSKYLSYLKDKRFSLLLMLILLLGVSYRITLFIQNRNLIIDEANVVRNVYERDFAALLQPLSYEQYAPPLFLWQLELCSRIFGYSEYAMRLPALLWGIASLFAYTALARKLVKEHAVWFTVGLLAGAPPLVKYAAEVKQYGPDVCIAIILTYAALKADIFAWSRRRFFLFWSICGSIALWASQPSVFILAAIGLYYFTQCLQQKKWHYWKLLLPIALLWFAEFAAYYILILQPQINSTYLQNYHRDFFLYALPANRDEWYHNWIRIREVLNNTMGYDQRSYYLCLLLIPMGAISWLRQSLPKFMLICGPVLLTLIAAALKQFSLIERVSLFMLPFTMLTAGRGFALFMEAKWRFVKSITVVAGLAVLWKFNMGEIFVKRFQFQEITLGLDFLTRKGVSGNELIVDCASKDAYVYYLDIHPRRRRYESLKGAYLMPWGESGLASLRQRTQTTHAFLIFTGGGVPHRKEVMSTMASIVPNTKNYEFQYCYLAEFAQP